MADTEKEMQMFQKRILNLADKSFKQNIYTFTGFLGESDQDAFFAIQPKVLYAYPVLFGGSEVCERKMLRFGSIELFGYEEDFPICLIKIEPLIQKFADKLMHRDFLGALMNLGIERTTMGDIFVQENTGFVFCTEIIAPFIMENLSQVKHTHVKCSVSDAYEVLQKEELEEKEIIVASIRIDAIIAKLYNMSRTQTLDLFRTGKVRLNGKICTGNSTLLKTDDTVSVRGFGKFMYQEILHETRKGKESIRIKMYKSS